MVWCICNKRGVNIGSQGNNRVVCERSGRDFIWLFAWISCLHGCWCSSSPAKDMPLNLARWFRRSASLHRRATPTIRSWDLTSSKFIIWCNWITTYYSTAMRTPEIWNCWSWFESVGTRIKGKEGVRMNAWFEENINEADVSSICSVGIL
jgi:hypothetical protein